MPASFKWLASAGLVVALSLMAVGCDESDDGGGRSMLPSPADQPPKPAATQPAAYGVPDGGSELVLDVAGMTCSGCEKAVVAAVTQVDGVSAARASAADGKLWVAAGPDARVDVAAITAAVASTGKSVVPAGVSPDSP